MQDLKNLTRVVVTLKSGVRIEIYLEAAFEEEYSFEKLRLEGFMPTPLIVKKKIGIKQSEIAAIEVTEEPNIVWGDHGS